MEGRSHQFQGVVCCSLDTNTSVNESIYKLLKLNANPTLNYFDDIPCYDLELKNKYYQATINLFDYDSLTDDRKINSAPVLEKCHAIILHINGMTATTDQLDARLQLLEAVRGEPRIMLCDDIDSDCSANKTLSNWCIQNGFHYIRTDEEEDIRVQVIDSLSAYKWAYRIETGRPEQVVISTANKKPVASNTMPTRQPQQQAQQQQQTSSNAPTETSDNADKPKLSEDLVKKLMDFDSLLSKLSAYRDQPELRGDPHDKNIEEIAEILSGLLSDDIDNFLDTKEDANNKSNGNVPTAAAGTASSSHEKQ